MTDKCWSFDGEIFNYDALGELLDNHGSEMEPGQVVEYGDKKEVDVTKLVCADDIIEMLGERAWDRVGEAADDFPDVGSDGITELNSLLKGWIAKHCQPRFWEVVNTQKYVVTAEDLKPYEEMDEWK